MISNRCVTCGIPAKYLFTEYGQDNFVLEICPGCKRFIDPYIETSSIILILDLFLIKPQVYYHLLFNLNHSFQRFNSNKPPSSGSSPSSSLHSLNRLNQTINVFNRFQVQYSFLVYCSILILESSLQAVDDLPTGERLLSSSHLESILFKLSDLILYIAHVVGTATVFSKFLARADHLDPTRRLMQKSIEAIIISFLPGIVLYLTILIFQNSYGTRSPPRLFCLIENAYCAEMVAWVKSNMALDMTPIFDHLIGIDMDQLGSIELKQLLIRNLMGSLSCSVGITVPFGHPWAFGFAVLAWASVQKELARYAFAYLMASFSPATLLSS